MNYELIKNEFIKLKKEELDYIDNIANISNNKILLECEKIEIYRTLNSYQNKLTEMFKKILNELIISSESTNRNHDDIIIEFDIDKDFLSILNFRNEQYKKYVLKVLGIDENSFKFKLTLRNIVYFCHNGYRGIDSDMIQNKQKLIENPIYIFEGYFEEECYGPCPGDSDSYIYGIYRNICCDSDDKEILKKI